VPSKSRSFTTVRRRRDRVRDDTKRRKSKVTRKFKCLTRKTDVWGTRDNAIKFKDPAKQNEK
jgi:hypothetical protein